MMNRIKDMDGRDRPGHDEGEASNIIEGWYYMPAGKCALLEAIADSCSSIIPAADVAVVVAHPDDESLGCGAQLARLKGGTVILVTDGAPCDPCYANRHGFRSTKAYAQARLAETRTALKLAGVPECNL